MVRGIIGGDEGEGRAQPQHEHRDVQAYGGEVHPELPQRQNHEHDYQQHEEVDAEQQARDNKDDQCRACGDGLRHVAAGLLVDPVERLLGLFMELFVAIHNSPDLV